MGNNALRMGLGYDVHRLTEGRDLILGGVKIPFEKGLLGHSDGDVLLHAVCDALLGAAGLGDIGRHFPDTDPHLTGAASERFLYQSHRMITEAGFVVNNVDATVIAEAPHLNPFFGDMADRLSKVMETPIERINLKATTHEGLGAIGRGEAMAAMSIVSLMVRE